MGIIYKGDVPLGIGVGGVSAYESAVAAGYTGTAEEFAARMAASPTTITFTATIGTTWTGTSAPYTQNLTVPMVKGYTVLEADNPIIDVVLPGDPVAANAILEAWGNVSRIGTVDGGLVITCNGQAPTVAIPIQIKTVRINAFQQLVTIDNIAAVMESEGLGARYYDATLTTTWAGSVAPFTQTVNIAGIISTDRPVIDVVLSSDMATSKDRLEAWANVSRIYTIDGAIVAECYDSKPTIVIPIQLKVVK